MLTHLHRLRVFHPFLFALYPILAAYARNFSQVQVGEVIRPIVVMLLVTTIAFLVLGATLKDWDRAGFITSLLLFVFMYYGYYTHFPLQIELLGLQISRHFLLMGLWVIFFYIVTHKWVWKRVRPSFVTRYLNLLAIISFFFPIRVIFISWFNYNPLYSWKPNLPPIEVSVNIKERPDIYYIILDGYGRSDMLLEEYGYDNTEFTNFLRSRGFYVADQARSNYFATFFSLSSSLNMTYLDILDQFSVETIQNLRLLIVQNRVFKFLKEQGYQIVTFSTGFEPTEILEVDYYINPKLTPFNNFEVMLLQTSVAWIPFELIASDKNVILPGYDAHRKRILYQFEELPKLVELKGPKFVFLHVLAPHPPFVFGPQGEEISPDRVYSMMDGSQFQGTFQEYLTSYPNQLRYINKLTQKMIDQLLRSSTKPPIILLQGDHGPGAYLEWPIIEQSCIRERTSILSAYYLPGPGKDELYPSITPVNSFRLIFDIYFGTELGLLEDKTWGWPYSLQPHHASDITTHGNTPCVEQGQK
jgi:hypothetical protein